MISYQGNSVLAHRFQSKFLWFMVLISTQKVFKTTNFSPKKFFLRICTDLSERMVF